jgi:hypothetical protein
LVVFSNRYWLALLDWSDADNFASTSWYRRNLASWAGKTVVDAGGGGDWDTNAKISTRWLESSELALGSLFIAGDWRYVGFEMLSREAFRSAQSYFEVCVTTLCKASVSRWTSCGSACMAPALWSPKLPYWFVCGSSKRSRDCSS